MSVPIKAIRVVRTIERPFMVEGTHAGRAACWREFSVLGVLKRVHITVPLYDKLLAAGVPSAEYVSALDYQHARKAQEKKVKKTT